MLSYCYHILIFQIVIVFPVIAVTVIAGWTGNLFSAFTVIAGSTDNLCIIRCPIRSGMTSTYAGMTSIRSGRTSINAGRTSIHELSEFRADNKFLVVTLLDTADNLRVNAEALRDGDDLLSMLL